MPRPTRTFTPALQLAVRSHTGGRGTRRLLEKGHRGGGGRTHAGETTSREVPFFTTVTLSRQLFCTVSPASPVIRQLDNPNHSGWRRGGLG